MRVFKLLENFFKNVMRAPVLLLFLVLTFFGFLFLSFRRDLPPQEAGAPLPTRSELWQSMFESRRIDVVYSSGAPEITEGYRKLYAGAQPRRFKLSAFADRDYPVDSLGATPLRLVGALSSNRILKKILPGLPIEKIEGGFRFAGKTYRDSSDLIYLFYPNPRHPRRHVQITTGNSDRAILDHLQNVGSSRNADIGDYWIFSQGRMQVIGFFRDAGPGAWQTETAHELSWEREQKISTTTGNFVFITHGENFQAAELEQLGARAEANLRRLLERLRLPPTKLENVTPLPVHLWDSFEKKALFTRNADLRHYDARRDEVHLIWAETIRGDDFFAEAQRFIAKLFVQTPSPALQEGLAVALTHAWRGDGFDPWTARLLATGNAISIEELFDPNIWRAESPLTRQPLLGSLVSFMLSRYSPEEFARLYREWPEKGVPDQFPQNDTWESLKTSCHDTVVRVTPVAQRQARAPKISPDDFHRGFCYAHEGYQVYNGYMGHRSQAALEKLATLGVNAISLTPFGYLENTHRPDFLRRSGSLGAENDESLLAAMQWARGLGMRVMLKPHMWVGASEWGWPGEVKMNSPEDWKIFFDRYERWMRHYAMLAEIYDFDSLCLGVELVQVTRGHEAEWRAMIHRLRGIYSGPMVYAANWGEEFESVNFWNALDAIAINCYYPLSEHAEATDAELLAGAKTVAEKIAAIAARHRKPVLITEIGFCSRPGTWVQPHHDQRRAEISLEAQRRCYEAIFKALWGRPWLAGIYWWKWPTDLADGGPGDNQFTPNGKSAAQVVANWYKQAAGSQVPSSQ